MKRRSFLLGLGASALAAPAVVRAENLMKIWVPPNQHFLLSGRTVYDPNAPLGIVLSTKGNKAIVAMTGWEIGPYRSAPWTAELPTRHVMALGDIVRFGDLT